MKMEHGEMNKLLIYNMEKFKIDYITLEGDLSSVWIEAYTAEEAKIQLKREYWDVQEIIRIRK